MDVSSFYYHIIIKDGGSLKMMQESGGDYKKFLVETGGKERVGGQKHFFG